MVFTYDDVRTRLKWGESDELEFKPEPTNEQTFRKYVFETVVGMANVSGGTLVIGVREEKNEGIKRTLVGVKDSASDISDKLTQIVNEYVEPPGLKFHAYQIASDKPDEPPLVGIEVKRQRGVQYGVRYDGLSSQKATNYKFFLRLNGETRQVTFATFKMYSDANTLRELKSLTEAPESPFREYSFSVGSEKPEEFNYDKLRYWLSNYEQAKNPKPKSLFFTEIRMMASRFPGDPANWNEKFTELVRRMLEAYSKEKDDPKASDAWLDIIRSISGSCDETTLKVISEALAAEMLKLYDGGSRNRDVLILAQRLKGHDKSLIRKIVVDSIDSWSDEDFGSLSENIDIDAADSRSLGFKKELHDYVLNRLQEEKDDKKYSRLDRIYKRCSIY